MQNELYLSKRVKDNDDNSRICMSGSQPGLKHVKYFEMYTLCSVPEWNKNLNEISALMSSWINGNFVFVWSARSTSNNAVLWKLELCC